MGHTNEITFNILSAGDILNNWGQIDLSGYPTYEDDEEVCFKLSVWSLQCKFATLVTNYSNHLTYGVKCGKDQKCLKIFQNGLKLLNRYDPRDIVGDTTDYNNLPYSTILTIINTLHNKYQ